jgi:hypothetical protein
VRLVRLCMYLYCHGISRRCMFSVITLRVVLCTVATANVLVVVVASNFIIAANMFIIGNFLPCKKVLASILVYKFSKSRRSNSSGSEMAIDLSLQAMIYRP